MINVFHLNLCTFSTCTKYFEFYIKLVLMEVKHVGNHCLHESMNEMQNFEFLSFPRVAL